MKILVTGTAGFIGYHLANRLIAEGHEVIGLDSINNYYDVSLKIGRLESAGIPRNKIAYKELLQSQTQPGYQFIQMRLEDEASLNRLFREQEFDMVCHLAAQAGVRYSLKNPKAYIQSNIVGFSHILEACRHFKIKHLVYASSSSVYGLNKKMPFSTQDHVDHPVSLYAASKKSNELMEMCIRDRGTYSCATCHVPSAGFMPGRSQGIADGALGFGNNGEGREQMNNYMASELDVQGARPISVLNVAYVTNTTWSGKFGAFHANEGTEYLWGLDDPTTETNHLGLDGLEAQNIEGLIVHRMVVDDFVLDSLGYRAMFDQAFTDFPAEERYSLLTSSFAISAYLRSLITNRAPFQEWLKGEENAITESEKRGAVLFYSKAGCYRCHEGPAMSANEFHAVGVNDLCDLPSSLATGIHDIRNMGRGGFTLRDEDLFKFKVPGIYNMGDSPFYFHGSSKNSLRDVVEYFNEGIPENPRVPKAQISPFFHPLNLKETEVDDLVAFLENSLRDPDLERYVPAQVLSNNCFPNNDPTSREELGCE